MIMNQTPYPISFEQQTSQALVCRYGEEMRQYIFKPDFDVSGLSCLLQIAKTDGTFTENGVEVHTDPDTGECTLVITIPQQATVVKGLNRYSICVYGEIEGEDHLLYSAEGPLWVDDNLITDDMIASVAEVNGLVFPQDFLTVENLVDIVNYVVAEIIKDDTTSDSTTWSSQKITDEISGHISPMSLDDLTDVVITSPAAGDDLQYDGAKWVNAPLPDPSVTKTATGNPIEITDAAAAPMVKCVTEITGSQDLHGYDKPWVGGAGANLLPPPVDGTYTGNGVTAVVSNGKITMSGTTTASGNAIIIPLSEPVVIPANSYLHALNTISNGSLAPSFELSTDYATSNFSFSLAPANRIFTIQESGQGITIDRIRLYIGANINCTMDFSPMLMLNNTTTAWTPYSNLCPITAYTEGEIEVSDGDGNTTTHTTTFPDAIYRGSEDVVGEKLVVTHGIFDMSTATPTPATSDARGRWNFGNISNIKTPANNDTLANVIFEQYEVVTANNLYNNINLIGGTITADGRLLVRGVDLITQPQGYMVYELATPVEVDITPTNLPIRTLSGYTHIESSTGDLTLEYLTQTYDPIADLIDRSAIHVYSTEEKVVGKWVDNKDVYEKTFILGTEITLAANQWNYITGVTLSSVDTPIDAEIRNSRGITVANIDFLDSPVSVWGQNGNEKVKSITFRYTKS